MRLGRIPDIDPVTDPESCLWCDQMPTTDAGWVPGEMLAHVRAAHPDLLPEPSSRFYPDRQPGVVLPPAP